MSVVLKNRADRGRFFQDLLRGPQLRVLDEPYRLLQKSVQLSLLLGGPGDRAPQEVVM